MVHSLQQTHLRLTWAESLPILHLLWILPPELSFDNNLDIQSFWKQVQSTQTEICHFGFMGWCEKGVKIWTYDFCVTWSLMMQCPSLNKSRQITSQPLLWKIYNWQPYQQNKKTGTWTRVPWNKKETKSVIDYIVIKKEDEQLVRDNIVDEADSMKIQIPPQHSMPRLKNTAHNWKHNENPLETKNEEGWKDFNEEVQKLETEG